MPIISHTTTRSFLWFLLLVVIAVGALGAFWVLLGGRFSPENFEIRAITDDAVESRLFGAALVVAVSALLLSARQRDAWRRLAYVGLPLLAVSSFVLVRVVLFERVRMYDMLLFCVACGGTAIFWVQNKPLIDGRDIRMMRVFVWGLVIFLAAYQFWDQVRHLNDFALGYADCGENARLMFNSITNPHELFLRVNPDKPLFYDHVDIGIIPFLPLWLLWPDLKLTILLEIVAVLGVVVPLYFIAERLLQDESEALLVVLAWVLYPSTSQFVYSASYGFRWGNMCLLLYFVALAFWVYERRGWALACALWAVLIKEEAAILIGMFGVYLALFQRRKAAGAALTFFAFGYFLLISSVLIPAVSGQSYAMTRFFRDLGQTKWEILTAPLARPEVFWGRMVEPTSLYFAAVLLAPLLFVPLRKLPVLFIGSLTFVFCCMNPILKNICFHYQAALLPVVFWALILALQGREAKRRFPILVGIVVSCGAMSLFLGALPWSKATLPVYRMPNRLDLVRRIRSQIDPQGALFATQRVAAHFVTQRYLYLDPPLPGQIDYAVLDMRDSWCGVTGDVRWLQKLRNLQREVEANPHLHLTTASDGLLFYSHHGTSLDRQELVEYDRLPEAIVPTKFDLGGGVSVVGCVTEPMAASPGNHGDCLRVTAFLTISTPTNIDFAVRCMAHLVAKPGLNSDYYATEYQPLGQSIWPVEHWKTDKYYAEVFLLTLPSGASNGSFAYSFDLLNLSKY
jgi:uncharacterized membrane protein